MGNETDTAGLIPRRRIFTDADFCIDVDARGKYFLYAPDGTHQDGLSWDQVMRLQNAISVAIDHIADIRDKRKELPK